MTHPPAPPGSKRRKALGWLFNVWGFSRRPHLYSDKVFNHVDWDWHRNAAWRHRMEPRVLLSVAGGFIWQLVHVLVVSVLVGLYHVYLVPKGWPGATTQLSNAFSMITFCLSLLLVFRTNSSYSRWWEARTLWGRVVNLSRNYARQVFIWSTAENVHVARLGARFMCVAVHCMRAHLRPQPIGKPVTVAAHLLTPEEFLWLSEWRSSPQGAAHVMAWAATNMNLTWQREQVLTELVNDFVNNLGGCERILRTPLPTAYTRHTSRFLLTYLTMAPALLWPVTGWASPLLAAAIAFLLLGTENIGVQIEEPFTVLPLDAICGAIELSITDMELQHFGESTVVQKGHTEEEASHDAAWHAHKWEQSHSKLNSLFMHTTRHVLTTRSTPVWEQKPRHGASETKPFLVHKGTAVSQGPWLQQENAQPGAAHISLHVVGNGSMGRTAPAQQTDAHHADDSNKHSPAPTSLHALMLSAVPESRKDSNKEPKSLPASQDPESETKPLLDA